MARIASATVAMSLARLAPAFAFALTLAYGALVPAARAAALEIVSAEFGLFEVASDGSTAFSPGTTVPRKPGQRYGWVIELRQENLPRSLLVREEYLQPSRAPMVRNPQDDSLRIVNPRRQQVSERRLVPVAGQIVGEWIVGDNEPPGERHLAVVIDGAPETRFDYRVE